MKAWIQKLKKEWRRFLQSPPGRRFQDFHDRRRTRRGTRQGSGGKGLLIAGIAITVAGIVLLPLPGPGSIIVAGGLMLVASESVIVARILDRADKIRADLMKKLRSTFKGKPKAAKGPKDKA